MSNQIQGPEAVVIAEDEKEEEEEEEDRVDDDDDAEKAQLRIQLEKLEELRREIDAKIVIYDEEAKMLIATAGGDDASKTTRFTLLFRNKQQGEMIEENPLKPRSKQSQYSFFMRSEMFEFLEGVMNYPFNHAAVVTRTLAGDLSADNSCFSSKLCPYYNNPADPKSNKRIACVECKKVSGTYYVLCSEKLGPHGGFMPAVCDSCRPAHFKNKHATMEY